MKRKTKFVLIAVLLALIMMCAVGCAEFLETAENMQALYEAAQKCGYIHTYSDFSEKIPYDRWGDSGEVKLTEDGNIVLIFEDGTLIDFGKAWPAGIYEVYIDENGSLVLVLTDGRVLTFDNVLGNDGKDGQDGKDGAQGPQGEKGAAGVNGKDGIDGKDGQDGADGQDGLTPYIGDNGNWWIGEKDTGIKAAGTDGVNGKDGQDGKDGVDGKDGKDGVDGKDGQDGKDGAQGPQGEKGETGADGKDGRDGVDGKDGKDGVNGVGVSDVYIDEDGNLIVTLTDGSILNLGKVLGADGKDGVDGTNGKDGKDGVDGKDGKDGTQGPQGEKGEKGDTGAQGPQGEKGADGVDGKDGQDGADGKDGLTPYIGDNGNWWIGETDTGIKAAGTDGVNGKDGINGRDGVDGKDGKDGADGKDGVNGKDGVDGKDGTQGPQGEKGEKGDTGAQGPQGEKGADGVDGQDGADGQDGLTPYIGENGNWWIGETDTGIKAAGTNGKDGVDGKDGQDGVDGKDGLTPHIGENGNWWIGETDTNVKAEAHTHQFGEWDIVFEASCDSVGYEMRSCECGFSEYRMVEKKEHIWAETFTLTDATCQKEGLALESCTSCGMTRTKVLPKTAHEFVEGKCLHCNAEEPKFAYELSEEGDGYIVTGPGRLEEGDSFMIPAEINGIPVLSIKSGAFKNFNLSDVEIHAQVIGNEAFRGLNKLSELKLGDEVIEIGNFAFADCEELEKVLIPDSVQRIGEGAFDNCSGNFEISFASDCVWEVGDQSEQTETLFFEEGGERGLSLSGERFLPYSGSEWRRKR